MLKYMQYINEDLSETKNFKVGDIVIFNCKQRHDSRENFNGKKCEIITLPTKDNPHYRLYSDKTRFSAGLHELTLVNNESMSEETKEKVKFKRGDKVIFNCDPARKLSGLSVYDGKIAEIKEVFPLTGRFKLVLRGKNYSSIEFTANDSELKSASIEDVVEGSKFKEGDSVIFHPGPKQKYYSHLDGKKCKVMHDLGQDMYNILTVDGASISASSSEMTHDDKKTIANYVENQFTTGDSGKLIIGPSKKASEFFFGQRVIVDGTEGRFIFKDRKATIKRENDNQVLVEFDDDDSKNERKFSMMVDKKIVRPSNEPTVIVLKVGDKVECVDNLSQFYGKKGEVTKTWPDGESMVEFKDMNTSITLKPEQVKVTEYAKAPIGFKIGNTSVPIKTSPKADTVEEEDEDDSVTVTKTESLKKADLVEFSYKDFFDDNKISTKEELIENKNKYEKTLENTEIPELKKDFYEKSLRTAEIIEQYFDFLIAKVAKDLPVYRTVEKLDNGDLLSTKTKVRASESKELTKKYSFDQGIIAYWKFKDAVVFKTI